MKYNNPALFRKTIFTISFLLVFLNVAFFIAPAHGQKVEVCIFDECEDVSSSGNNSGGSMTSMGTSSGDSSGGSMTSMSSDNNEEFVEDIDKEEVLLVIKNLYTEELTPSYEISNIVNSSTTLSFSDKLMILTASVSNLDLALKNLKGLRNQLTGAAKNKQISKKSLSQALKNLQCAFRLDKNALNKIDKIREDSINKSELTEANIAVLSKTRLKLLDAFKCKKAAVETIDGASLLPATGIQELNTLEGQIADDALNPD